MVIGLLYWFAVRVQFKYSRLLSRALFDLNFIYCISVREVLQIKKLRNY